MVVKKFQDMSNGLKIPSLGLGTAVCRTSELETVLNAALEHGYRYIDTAYVYGNEKEIGKILNEWFKSGKLKREDLFITTKLPIFGVHQDRVEFFMKRSLQNLGVDYVDLYLVHFPVGSKYDEKTDDFKRNEKNEYEFEGRTDFAAVWKKMEEQVDAGRTKSIGISNFTVPQIQTVLQSARIKPANLQIEFNVHFQQQELLDFAKKNGITVTGYCPLGSPGLDTYLKKEGYQEEIKIPNILEDPVIKKIADKHNKTSAQVALRFLLQIGVIPIPKSSNVKEVKENFALFDFNLDETDIEKLKNLDRGENGRIAVFKIFEGVTNHPDCPF